MDWLTPDRYLSALPSETARLAALLTGRDPAEPVPACPGWTLRDLVTHVGTGHRLATGLIRAGLTSLPPGGAASTVPAPDDPADWTGWLGDGAGALATVVRERGFDSRVWTWVPQHQTAGFWVRRMLHDLIIHRFDAGPTGRLDDDLTRDGIADILLCFATIASRPQSPMAGLRGGGETLQFDAGEHGWHVTLTADGPVWRPGSAPADVRYRAPEALDLLLVLNRRRAPGPSTGDRALLDRWLEHSRF